MNVKWLLPLAAGLLGLAACGGDGGSDAESTPPAPPSASASASAPPSAPASATTAPGAPPATSAAPNPYAGRTVEGVFMKSGGAYVFAPVKITDIEPGVTDVVRTAGFRPVAFGPAARYYGVGLTIEDGQSKITKPAMSRAAFEKAVAQVREKPGKKISGTRGWRVRFDGQGLVVEAAQIPGDL